ncbi:MAG: putative spermidine/putrescine transport system substrate-binding protein [Frankiaceae bacterium]|nr:putative spermidine/putrescine transport system substrate-binding protein [Frankiaceae bacterium]
MPTTKTAVVALTAGVALALAGCSSSTTTPAGPPTTASGGGTSTSTGTGSGSPTPSAVQHAAPPAVPTAQAVGAGEGALNIIVWAGYAEDGSNDKTVDWVHPFEKATSCKVNVKVGNTSDEMVTLMKTGQYDGVSASGDATLRLIYSGDVAPVNTALVPNYATISTFLKDAPWNSVNKQMYGIPHGWGANVLSWRPDKVSPAPDSWSVVFDTNSPYKGKVTAYDSPIYIADAALYLKATKPELNIVNPYELDDTQFQAAVDLLTQQKGIVGEYWSDYTKAVSALESGNTVLGTEWQVNDNLVNSGKKTKVLSTVPKEGSTGWSDTWMISSKAAHPNCMYKWMDYITSATVNAQVAEWFGEAPAQTKACDKTVDKTFCKTYHATDATYSSKISYWTTPIKDCGDDRGNVCKDYAAWTQAWTTIRG